MNRKRRFEWKQVKALVEAADRRHDVRRDEIAGYRYLYRTGIWDPNVNYRTMMRGWSSYAGFRERRGPANVARRYLDLIVSHTASRIPQFVVDSNSQADEDLKAARVQEALVRTWFEDAACLPLLQRMGLDNGQCGNGFAHAHWRYEEETVEDAELRDMVREALNEFIDDQVFEQRVGGVDLPDVEASDELVDTVLSGVSDRELDALGLPTMRQLFPELRRVSDDDGERWVRVLRNEPVFEYVSPLDLLVPEWGSDVEDLPWYAIRRIVRLADVKDNDAYDKAAREAAAPAFLLDADGEQRSVDARGSLGEHDVDPMTVIYTFYDRASSPRRVVTFAQGADKPLLDVEDPNEFDEPCLFHLGGYRDGEAFWRFGDLENIRHLMGRLGEINESQDDNLDRQGTVWVLLDNGSLPEDLAEAFETAEAGSVVRVKVEGMQAEGLKINELLQAVPVPALSSDVYQARGETRSDIAEVMGLNEYMLGGSGPSRGSGTQAAVAQGVADQAAQPRVTAYEEAAAKMARVVLRMCQQFMSEDEVVEVIGADGDAWQENVDPYDLLANLRIRIREGSLAQTNPARRRQSGVELLGTAQMLQSMGASPEFMEALLRKAAVDLDLELPPGASVLAQAAPAPSAPAPVPGGVSGQDEVAALGGPVLDTGEDAPIY